MFLTHASIKINKYTARGGHLGWRRIFSLGDINLGLDYQWYRKRLGHFYLFDLGVTHRKQFGGSDGNCKLETESLTKLYACTLVAPIVWKTTLLRQANFGVNQRSKAFPMSSGQEWKQVLKLLIRKFWARAPNLIESFKNRNLDATTSNGSIFANNVEVVNLGGEMIFDVYKVNFV